MILVKAVTHSDWKYRADHNVEIVATGSEKILRKIVKYLIIDWQASQLSEDLEAADKKPLTDREMDALKKNPAKLAKKWEDNTRWEMEDCPKNQRILCGGDEGDAWSVSFTILPDWCRSGSVICKS